MYNKKQVETQEFKSKPMKRYESDYLSFKEIFVQPREQILRDIQTREPTQDLKASFHEKLETPDEVLWGRRRTNTLNRPKGGITISGLTSILEYSFWTINQISRMPKAAPISMRKWSKCSLLTFPTAQSPPL
jgi:hypothetical protein